MGNLRKEEERCTVLKHRNGVVDAAWTQANQVKILKGTSYYIEATVYKDTVSE